MHRSPRTRNPGGGIGGIVSALVLVLLVANMAIPPIAFAQRATAGVGARTGSIGASRTRVIVEGASRSPAPIGRSPVVSGSRYGVSGTRARIVPVPPAIRTAPGARAPWRGSTHAGAVRSFRREGPWEVFYLRHQVPRRLTGSHRPPFLAYGSRSTVPQVFAQADVGSRAGNGLAGSPPAEIGLPGLCRLDQRRLCLPAGIKPAFEGSLQLWCASRHLNFDLDRSGSGLVAECPESDVQSVWLRHPDLDTPVRIAPGACPSDRGC